MKRIDTYVESWPTPHRFHIDGAHQDRFTIRDRSAAVVFSVLPIVWGAFNFGRLMDRARKSGRCCACGYDLRASKNRCPECGTPIPAEAKA